MADSGIEYGTALYEVAKLEGIEKEVYEDFCSIINVLQENKEYYSLLSSPAISISKRISLLDETFSSSYNHSLLALIKTMIKKHEANQLNDAFYHYEQLYNIQMKIKTAVVTTSDEITDEQKEKIITMLEDRENSKVNVKFQTNKDILGGIIIDINGEQIDGSIRNKLNNIKKVMDS